MRSWRSTPLVCSVSQGSQWLEDRQVGQSMMWRKNTEILIIGLSPAVLLRLRVGAHEISNGVIETLGDMTKFSSHCSLCIINVWVPMFFPSFGPRIFIFVVVLCRSATTYIRACPCKVNGCKKWNKLNRKHPIFRLFCVCKNAVLVYSTGNEVCVPLSLYLCTRGGCWSTRFDLVLTGSVTPFNILDAVFLFEYRRSYSVWMVGTISEAFSDYKPVISH